MNAPTSNDSKALKEGMKAIWMAGDFGQIAKRNAQEAATFVGRLGLNREMRVLDVACGTGNLAIPAAKLGAQVDGVDIATNLIEQAKARAVEEGVEANTRFAEGDAEQLQFSDSTFDAVVTMYGAMFAPRPDLVAAELLRVCKPGGLIAMANWTPEGFVGEMFTLSAKHVPPPPGVPAPALWGKEEVARQRFTDAARSLSIDPARLKFEFIRRMHVFKPEGSPSDVVEFFRTYFGPTKVAFSRLDADGQAALRADLISLWSRHNRADDLKTQTLVDAEYLEVRVRKD